MSKDHETTTSILAQVAQTTDLCIVIKKRLGAILDLLDQAVATPAAAPRTRSLLLQSLRLSLLVHAEAEERVFYRACDRVGELCELVEHAREDHEGIRDTVARLLGVPLDAPVWLDMLFDLKRMVERHVYNGERRLLAACRNHFEREQLGAMGRLYEDTRLDIEDAIPAVEVGAAYHRGYMGWPRAEEM